MPKQDEAKGDGVINPQNYNFVNFKTRKILMLLETVRINRSTVILGYMCPRGPMVHQQ